jgi:hypothetical protein
MSCAEVTKATNTEVWRLMAYFVRSTDVADSLYRPGRGLVPHLILIAYSV